MCKQQFLFLRDENQKKAIKQQASDMGIAMTDLVDIWLGEKSKSYTAPRERDALVKVCLAAIKHKPELESDVVSLLA